MFARSGAPSKRPSRESRSRDPIGNLLRCGRTSTATSSDLTRRPPSLASRSTTWRVLALIRLTLAHAWDENEVSRAGPGRPAPRLLPFVPSGSGRMFARPRRPEQRASTTPADGRLPLRLGKGARCGQDSGQLREARSPLGVMTPIWRRLLACFVRGLVGLGGCCVQLDNGRRSLLACE